MKELRRASRAKARVEAEARKLLRTNRRTGEVAGMSLLDESSSSGSSSGDSEAEEASYD